jgi:hypothetical protein
MANVAEELDVLFENALEVMESLGSEFTSQEFVKRIAQRNQRAYVELLWECRDRDGIFNAAHEHIGGRLSQVAQKNGYEMTKEGRTELDIFGNSTGRVVYRRSR